MDARKFIENEKRRISEDIRHCMALARDIAGRIDADMADICALDPGCSLTLDDLKDSHGKAQDCIRFLASAYYFLNEE